MKSGSPHCIEGQSIAGRIAVKICTESNGENVDVRTRSQSTNRRLAGVEDFVVAGGKLVKELQRLVKSLG